MKRDKWNVDSRLHVFVLLSFIFHFAFFHILFSTDRRSEWSYAPYFCCLTLTAEKFYSSESKGKLLKLAVFVVLFSYQGRCFCVETLMSFNENLNTLTGRKPQSSRSSGQPSTKLQILDMKFTSSLSRFKIYFYFNWKNIIELSYEITQRA